MDWGALVLVQPESFGHVFPSCQDRIRDLQQSIEGLQPEEINEGKNSHPSARIRRYFPGYRKALHGPRLVQCIGLQAIRSRCPHFDRWMRRLEALHDG